MIKISLKLINAIEKKIELDKLIRYWKMMKPSEFKYLNNYTKEQLIAMCFDVNNQYIDVRDKLSEIKNIVNKET